MFDCIHKARQALLTALADCDELADIMPIILADDKSHYLGFSLDCAGQVSYASKPDYKLDHKRRTRTTLGRYLSRQLGVNASPSIDKAIGRIFAMGTFRDDAFDITDDVERAYATISDSCMSDNPNGCLSFYRQNGVQVLTYTLPGHDQPVARALLWPKVVGTDANGVPVSGQYVDRVYPNEGAHIEHYIRWAKEHGAHIRTNHSAGGFHGNLRVSICHACEMPYLDTFDTLSMDASTVATYGRGLECSYTNGAIVECCPCCGQHYFDDEEGGTIDSEEVCSQCYENANYCEVCDSKTHDEIEDIDGQSCCESCAQSANQCDRCRVTTFSDLEIIDDKACCADCAKDAVCCADCGSNTFEPTEDNEDEICPDCRDTREQEQADCEALAQENASA